MLRTSQKTQLSIVWHGILSVRYRSPNDNLTYIEISGVANWSIVLDVLDGQSKYPFIEHV